MASGRVDHQALGLVDYQHVFVLVHNIQGDLLGDNVDGLGLGDGDLDLVAGIELVILFSQLAAPQHTALFQQLLSTGTAQIFHRAGKKRVQPLAGDVSIKDHFFSSFQKALLKKRRCTSSAMQPQVIKQSATLNTGKSMNSRWIMSTT